MEIPSHLGPVVEQLEAVVPQRAWAGVAQAVRQGIGQPHPGKDGIALLVSQAVEELHALVRPAPEVQHGGRGLPAYRLAPAGQFRLLLLRDAVAVGEQLFQMGPQARGHQRGGPAGVGIPEEQDGSGSLVQLLPPEGGHCLPVLLGQGLQRGLPAGALLGLDQLQQQRDVLLVFP